MFCYCKLMNNLVETPLLYWTQPASNLYTYAKMVNDDGLILMHQIHFSLKYNPRANLPLQLHHPYSHYFQQNNITPPDVSV